MDGERDTSQPYFASKTYTLLSKNDSSEMDINEAFQNQFKSFDEYIARGSGWTLKHVIRMEIQTLQYRPIGGSNYFPLPESLQRSHSVVNIRNDDQKCFLWSILAHLHPAECNPNRIAHYTAYENELDMTGISYPVQVKHIPKFENQNDVAVMFWDLKMSNCSLYISLASLVDDLVNDSSQNYFKYLSKEFPSSDDRNLLLRKGVYPYGWVDGESKFNETCLPPKDAFYNDLTKSHISDEEYNHAKDLTDVFERFRYECKSNYGLDPAHFYTSPGLAWSAALKVTKCKLELITDDIRDVYLFIESGMRGGISQISNRYAAANNKYIPKTYDSTKESSYLIYQDCNSLYGLAMSMPLPTGKFRFLRDNEQAHFNISDVDLEGEKGYILEVDLDYPEDLHDSHSDYP
ncbi:unnamed protein product [Mytilus edulis]|uniref:DNA-directed DNA polymerase n=1 Tax=Mytilus edulis TaxID=6550 RepID=A0A8S3Q122_MYTED|nr:unnamed protein product [Mytilus edulis]